MSSYFSVHVLSQTPFLISVHSFLPLDSCSDTMGLELANLMRHSGHTPHFLPNFSPPPTYSIPTSGSSTTHGSPNPQTRTDRTDHGRSGRQRSIEGKKGQGDEAEGSNQDVQGLFRHRTRSRRTLISPSSPADTETPGHPSMISGSVRSDLETPLSSHPLQSPSPGAQSASEHLQHRLAQRQKQKFEQRRRQQQHSRTSSLQLTGQRVSALRRDEWIGLLHLTFACSLPSILSMIDLWPSEFRPDESISGGRISRTLSRECELLLTSKFSFHLFF